MRGQVGYRVALPALPVVVALFCAHAQGLAQQRHDGAGQGPPSSLPLLFKRAGEVLG